MQIGPENKVTVIQTSEDGENTNKILTKRNREDKIEISSSLDEEEEADGYKRRKTGSGDSSILLEGGSVSNNTNTNLTKALDSLFDSEWNGRNSINDYSYD